MRGLYRTLKAIKKAIEREEAELSPNPKSIQKDEEKIENAYISLMDKLRTNSKAFEFQAEVGLLNSGFRQAEDLEVIKNMQQRFVKYLRLIKIFYKPYPKYMNIFSIALTQMIADMAAINVEIYSNKDPDILFNQDVYNNKLNSMLKEAGNRLFNNLDEVARDMNRIPPFAL